MSGILSLKTLFIGFPLAVTGIVLSSVLSPVSTTYLMADVKTVEYNTYYKENFNNVIKEEFIDGVEQNTHNSNNPGNTGSGVTGVSGTREKIVQVAYGEVGTREGSRDNDIKYNKWYQPMHTWLSGYDEYCAIFTLWCMNEVGMYSTNSKGPPSIDSASCDELAKHYLNNKRFAFAKTTSYVPRPGDLILFTNWKVLTNQPHGYDSTHVGLVVNVDDQYIYTVEGNTSIPQTEFERAGSGVYSKKHKLPKNDPNTRILGYAVPWYDGEENFTVK